jgi:hypothetical protein
MAHEAEHAVEDRGEVGAPYVSAITSRGAICRMLDQDVLPGGHDLAGALGLRGFASGLTDRLPIPPPRKADDVKHLSHYPATRRGRYCVDPRRGLL